MATRTSSASVTSASSGSHLSCHISSISGEEIEIDSDTDNTDLHETLMKSYGRHPGGKKSTWYNQSIDEVKSFAYSQAQLAASLKTIGTALGFVITVSGNRDGTRDSRRICFGIPQKARNIIAGETLSGKIPRTLFKFNVHREGLFHAGPSNHEGFSDFIRYRQMYRSYFKIGDQGTSQSRPRPEIASRKPPKIWSQEDCKTLVTMRCADNPSTFRQIALALNRTHEILGSSVDRPFEAQDCSNKWSRMFPSVMDANKTLEYVRELRSSWPGLVFKTTTEKCKDKKRAPTLIDLHVVWPWAADLMASLSPSIFCDATYKVTLYHYKVVMITGTNTIDL